MATYRHVIYDIQSNLKKVFDDSDIRLPQILYWVQLVANKIRVQSQQITKSGLYTSTFSSVQVNKDNKGRYYIDLPSQIMDLPNERGVEYITYNKETGCCCSGSTFAQVFFQPTTVMQLHRLYRDEYEKPTPENPYFYRVGHKVDGQQVNRVYFAGVECITLKDVEIALKCTLDPANVCDLDDIIPVPDELISDLIKEVLSLGRFIMMIPEERTNEGGDETLKKEVTNRVQLPETNTNQQNQ